tara:strand:+ start:1732 stop:2289 length:558 start_codon:yes stop_codon:yes gene_type:complete
MKSETKDTLAKAATVLMFIGMAALVVISINMRKAKLESFEKRLTEEVNKQGECDKCEDFSRDLNRKEERSYETYLHQVVIGGDDYFVSETRYEDNGEQEYVVSRGVRKWSLNVSDPEDNFMFLLRHGKPKVERCKDSGLIRIFNDQGDQFAVISGDSKFILRTDVEWERVNNKKERQAAIDAIEE